MSDPRKAALGSWPNAPLVLVLAQIRFQPVSESIPMHVAETIKGLFGPARFPNTSNVHQLALVFNSPPLKGEQQPDSPVPQIVPGQPTPQIIGVDMRSAENSEAIRIQRDSFTYMTSAYVDSTYFSEQWKQFMGVLFSGQELHATRLGLRYVDFIFPSVGHVPEDYLKGLGITPKELGEQAPAAYNRFAYKKGDGGMLQLQYARDKGVPSLPMDLQNTVPLPAWVDQKIQKQDAEFTAILDMDRSRPLHESMTAEAAASALLLLRDDLAQSFRSIMTELAWNEWKNSTSGV